MFEFNLILVEANGPLLAQCRFLQPGLPSDRAASVKEVSQLMLVTKEMPWGCAVCGRTPATRSASCWSSQSRRTVSDSAQTSQQFLCSMSLRGEPNQSYANRCQQIKRLNPDA
jgi:hypothetical protein